VRSRVEVWSDRELGGLVGELERVLRGSRRAGGSRIHTLEGRTQIVSPSPT